MEEPKDEINSRKPRRCYLITYSQADLQFSTKQSFADAVIEAFTSERSQSSPQHWACCMEKHQLQGFHYHLALKLSAPKRWLGCKRALERRHGIVVYFSDHEGYYSAYKYVCKFDQEVFHSDNHPNLQEIGSPHTSVCQKAYRQKRSQASGTHAGHALRQKCRDAVCDHYIVGRRCSSKFKMAAECKGACLCTEQVVELLFRDNTDLETTQSNESDSEMEEVNISDNFTQKHKELLSSWLDKLSFENENFNKTFFKQTAMEQLLPLIDQATYNTSGNESEAAYLLRSSSICSLTCSVNKLTFFCID